MVEDEGLPAQIYIYIYMAMDFQSFECFAGEKHTLAKFPEDLDGKSRPLHRHVWVDMYPPP